MKPAKLGLLRFTPWIVVLLALLSVATWVQFRQVEPPAPTLILNASMLVGKCEALTELAASALSTQDELANAAQDEWELGQVAEVCARIRGELPEKPGLWFPIDEVRALLDSVDAQIGQARASLPENSSDAVQNPDPSRLLEDSAALRREIQTSLALATLHSPNLWRLAPGDILLAFQGVSSLLALLIWWRATFREPLDYLEREKRNLLEVSEINPPIALARCYELSHQFLETAQRILERKHTTVA